MWNKAIEDSSVAQDLMRRSAVTQARKQLLQLGKERFGRPKPAVAAAVKAIDDVGRLETLAVRLLTVNTWNDLLAP